MSIPPSTTSRPTSRRRFVELGLGLGAFAGLSACAGVSGTPRSSRGATVADDLGRAFQAVGEQGAGLVLDAHSGEEIASLQSFTTLEHAAGRGRFHPASTVKPLLVHAAVERGVIEPSFRVVCEGRLVVDDTSLECFDAHGELDIESGLATSCNVFAYEIARRMGRDGVVSTFEAAGLAESGVLRKAVSPEDFAATATVATGHGPLRVTARELGLAYVRLLSAPPTPAKTAVMTGLRAAVERPIGSARAAGLQSLAVAAKTGTAEHIDDEGRPVADVYDAWLVAVAPAEAPEIVLVMQTIASSPAPGSAARVAGEFLRGWAQRRPRGVSEPRR